MPDAKVWHEDKQFLEDLLNILDDSEWSFHDEGREYFTCVGCDGGGPKEGSLPKHRPGCKHMKVWGVVEAHHEELCRAETRATVNDAVG